METNELVYKLRAGVELLDITGSKMSFNDVARAVTGKPTSSLLNSAMKQGDDDTGRAKHLVCEVKAHHPPSSVQDLRQLESILCSDLKAGQRHIGKVLYLTLLGKTNREDSLGTHYDAQDSAGSKINLWSLVFDPLGDSDVSWPKEATIAVREPLFDNPPKILGKGRPRGPRPAICVHHPQDISPCHIKALAPLNGVTDAEQACKQHLRSGDQALLSKELFAAKTHFTNAKEVLHSSTCTGTRGEGVGPSTTSPSSHFDALQRLAYVQSELGCSEDSLAHVKEAITLVKSNPELTQQKRAQWQNLLLIGAKVASKLGLWYDALKICEAGDIQDNPKLLHCYERLQLKKKELHGEYDWATISQQINSGKSDVDVFSYMSNVSIRESLLAGRGLLADCSFRPGDLILCEKALALGTVVNAPANTDVQGLIPGETVLSRKASLLQLLAKGFLLNPLKTSRMFELHGGNELDERLRTSSERAVPIFNTYEAATIIKHNAHAIHTGEYSDRHGEMDPALAGIPFNQRRKPCTSCCGLWPTVSIANHSCLPNATWSWMGDLIVVRASTHIQEGEEIRLGYVPSNMSFEKRKARLLESYGFECKCKLCVAEGSASKEAEQIKANVERLFHQEEAFLVGPKQEVIKMPSENILEILGAMSAIPAYKDLPIPILAQPFFQLGLMSLGPMQQWPDAKIEKITLAAMSFNYCLITGLGVRLVDAETEADELEFTAHTQARRVGVLALMALAELNFIMGERFKADEDLTRSVRCQRCAKRLYLICYGEDATFDNHHQGYACKKLWVAGGYSR